MNAKGYIKCYKQRIKKKFSDLASEVDNLSSLLSGEILKLQETVETFQNTEEHNFLDVYHETNDVLEKFSEKLFFINNLLESDASSEACGSVTLSCEKKQVQCNDDEGKQEFPCEVPKENPESKMSSVDVCNQSAVLKSVSELNVEQIGGTEHPKASLFQNKETVDSCSSISETSSISRDNANSCFKDSAQTHRMCNDGTLPAEQVLKGGISQDSFFYSMSSQSQTSSCDNTTLLNNFPEFDKQILSPGSTITLVDQLESPSQSAKSVEKHTSENDLVNKRIPKPQVHVGTYIHAKVTEFQSPSEFWLQLWKHNDTLSYLSKLKSSTKLHPSAIKKDHYCLAPLDDIPNVASEAIFQRARIMNTFGSGENLTVVIFYVDFGYTRLIDSFELRVMPEFLFAHTARSIPCYLYGVSPKGYKWSLEANKKFQDITSYDGEVFIVCEKNGKYGVDFKIPLPENETCNLSDYLCCFDLAKAELESEVRCNVHSASTSSENNKDIDRDDKEYFISDENIDLNCSKVVSATSDNYFMSYLSKKLTNESMSATTNQCSNEAESEYCDFSSNERCEKTDKLSGNIPFVSHLSLPGIPKDCCKDQRSTSYEMLMTKEKHTKLQEFDWGYTIPPPKLHYFKEDLLLVIPSAIYSPNEFYVNPAYESSGPDFDSFEEKMSAFYNRISNSKDFCISEIKVKIGMYCCSKMNKDSCWYRAQILAFYDDVRTALVQCVDYGDNCRVPVHTLKPLMKEFAMVPAFAILCSLAFVIPDPQNKKPEWSLSSIEKFKDILGFDKCYSAKIIGSKQLLDERITLDVLLWDSTETGDRLINDVLIKGGLAVAAADAAADFLAQKPNGQTDSKDPMADWNPMADDYTSIRNSYKVCTDDVGIVMDGYKRKDEQKICKFFAATGKCSRHTCDFDHIRTGDDTVTRDTEYLTLPLQNDVHLPDPPSAVMGQISCVLNPAHFFLIFPFGTATVNNLHYSNLNTEECFAEYQALVTEMTSSYCDAPFDEVTTVFLSFGLIVAAKHGDLWLRARILDIIDVDKEVKVFFVDTGVTAWVKREWIREIQDKYLFTPFQAVEFMLSNIEPNDYQNGGKWSSQARTFFRKLLEEKLLIVYIDKKNGSTIHGRLKLTAEDGAVMINDLLVQTGFAQYTSSVNGSEVKLQNTHNEIPDDLPVPV